MVYLNTVMLLNLISLILSPFTKSFLKKLQKNESAQKVVKLYGEDKFTGIRFWDAPFIEVERFIPKKGKILDLGCGEGIFTNYLGLSSPLRNIIGIDLDETRIKKANHGVKNVAFFYGDAIKYEMPRVDCIIMFHLLHHLSSLKDQENLIKRCSENLPKDGRLIIVEVEPKFSLKYFLAWSTDHFLVPWLFEKRFYSEVFFRSSYDWRKLIGGFGFSCTITDASKEKPFSHMIFSCRKR